MAGFFDIAFRAYHATIPLKTIRPTEAISGAAASGMLVKIGDGWT